MCTCAERARIGACCSACKRIEDDFSYHNMDNRLSHPSISFDQFGEQPQSTSCTALDPALT